MTTNTNEYKKLTWAEDTKRDFRRNRAVYFMILPTLVYFFIFHYIPMYGAQIAFKSFSIGKGIWGSPWIGFKYFEQFFTSHYFWRLIRNTLAISLLDIGIGFPAPIILALLLNEIVSSGFKRTIQTITYLPYFVSLVVICGIIIDFTVSDGLINQITGVFGKEPVPFLSYPDYFRTIYISTNIWQNVGWGSIIYLAALTQIDPQLYDASRVDGANRWRQTLHVTLPGIAPTIIIMLILRLGRVMEVGFEKILLLYNPGTYEVADVISTFVYRKGLLESNFPYSTAVGLFNSVINFVLLVSVNKLSRKISETSLW